MKSYLQPAVVALLSVAAVHSAATEVETVVPASTSIIEQAMMPSESELMQRQARIGRVEIRVEEVFEETAPLAAPYRIANAVHIATRTRAVQAQLLFKSGDTFDRRILDETERALRAQRYLGSAEITPVRYNEDGSVDVLVQVQDVWTLVPSFSFSRKGGANSSEVEIEDSNLLGLGKELSLEKSSDVDRDTVRLLYGDPNLFGSRWKLALAYFDSSDGVQQALRVNRPFFSLDSRWSLGFSAGDQGSTISRYSLGKIVEQVDQQEQVFDVGGGISQGLKDGWVSRYLAGVHYERRSFSTQPDEPDAVLPADRTIAYPWLGLEIIEDRFHTTRNLDQIGRTEDLYLGRLLRVELGFAGAALGSTHDALVLDTRLSAGKQWNDRHFVLNSVQLRGRVEGGTVRNGVLDLGTRYHLRHSPRRVSFASLTSTLTSNLDPEAQLLLGGDTGLRGYPIRYQAGKASALLTLEERFYTNLQVFKLFNIGAAVFFDAGRTFGTDAFATRSLGWLKDIGAGLRLGSARSGVGNVIHVDLAYPLDGPRDLERLQFLIGTQRSF
jgi:outer membrane protein assembly factor BamA